MKKNDPIKLNKEILDDISNIPNQFIEIIRFNVQVTNCLRFLFLFL